MDLYNVPIKVAEKAFILQAYFARKKFFNLDLTKNIEVGLSSRWRLTFILAIFLTQYNFQFVRISIQYIAPSNANRISIRSIMLEIIYSSFTFYIRKKKQLFFSDDLIHKRNHANLYKWVVKIKMLNFILKDLHTVLFFLQCNTKSDYNVTETLLKRYYNVTVMLLKR